jgi:phosphoglycolate phosphatase-like HAD superfamily hydrolase
MLRLGVDDVRETAVAMSTEAGVKAGRRAGAGVVAGVLTGTVPDGRLRRAGASHVLGSVADLRDLLTATGPAEGLAGR